jgi:hypothetical protein
MGHGPVHLRFQKLIPIFFHAMDRNAVERHEDIGLSAGRLDSDMRTSLLDCTLFVSIVYPYRYSQPPLQ